MCRIDTKSYEYPDGTIETSERTIRCQYATGSSLCSQVERREVGSARLVEMRPTSASSTADPSSKPSSSSSSRSSAGLDLHRRSSKRRSGRYEISIVRAPSAETTRRRRSAPVPPPAPSPPPTGVELPSPGQNTWAADTAYVTAYRTPSRHSGVFNLEEVVPESSISSTSVEQASRLSATRAGPGLAIDTSRRSSGSASPALSSPGLSQIHRLNIRHDSVQGSPPSSILYTKTRRPRAGSSNLHSPRTGSASSGSTERRRPETERRPDFAFNRGSPSRNPVDDMVEEERRQMEMERTDARARTRLSADVSVNTSPRRDTGSRIPTGREDSESRSSLPYSVVVHHSPTTGRRNSVHSTGEDIVARQQARAEKRRSRDSEQRSVRYSDEAVREDSAERDENGGLSSEQRRRWRH